jgi:hypothetical protein
MSSDAWTSIRKVEASIRSFLFAKPNSAPFSSSLDVHAAELPVPGADQSSLLNGVAGNVTVTAQPGETLQQISLRTIGVYNVDIAGQVRMLNPGVIDFDQLKAGQKIRLPRISPIQGSVTSSEGASAAGKD